jgi:hypothetical protein
MSKQPPPPRLGLDAIARPAVAPSDVASPGAARELSKYAEATGLAKLTPKALHLHANLELIAELKRANEALAASHSALLSKHDAIGKELGELIPKYSSGRTARRRTAVTNLLGTAACTVGSGLVGCPEYIAKLVVTTSKVASVSTAVFGGGWGCIGLALVFMSVTTVCDLFFD